MHMIGPISVLKDQPFLWVYRSLYILTELKKL
jgi:hypothetical protein